MNYVVIGCGISGAVVARCLAEKGNFVKVYDRRPHIAGNMYDYIDDYGILVQKYGPHIFHTNDEEVYEFVIKYEEWTNYKLECGAVWDGKYTPTPFNFTTIDIFFDKEKAEKIKKAISENYDGQTVATVVDMLKHKNSYIREYAQFLFENDYAPYTAKQWGLNPKDVNPDVLKRVPIRLNYDTGYFNDKYEMMPKNSFRQFVSNILSHENIEVKLGIDAKKYLSFSDDSILWKNSRPDGKIIYTGPIDELFDCEYGKLPYRSLRFEWKHSEIKNIQNAPVVAYPKEQGFTRITEYNKLPIQESEGSTYALEYPLTYCEEKDMEPYYPVSTIKSEEQVLKYKHQAKKYNNLKLCGRLAEFKYYNMDQAIKNALVLSREILSEKEG